MDTTQDLILAELRELRADYNAHARETGERLSALESQMHTLVGNGQPGRIALLESAVNKLQLWRWWLIGMSAGASTVVSVLAWAIEHTSK
jgi:hypothetical protein